MKFKHRVIGRNTPENREFVKLLGYNTMELLECGSYIYTKNSGCYNLSESFKDIICNDTEYTNCTNSDELFKSVVAIREDGDFLQWFTNGERMELCLNSSFKQYLQLKDFFNTIDISGYRKATIKDLEEFNNIGV